MKVPIFWTRPIWRKRKSPYFSSVEALKLIYFRKNLVSGIWIHRSHQTAKIRMIDFTQFCKQSFSVNFNRIHIFKMIFIKSSSFHILFMLKIYFMVALILNPVVEVVTSYDIFTAKRIYKSKHDFQTWGFLWKFSI